MIVLVGGREEDREGGAEMEYWGLPEELLVEMGTEQKNWVSFRSTACFVLYEMNQMNNSFHHESIN